MAFTLNGFGTTYYGESNYQKDGSFQTTKWFVVAFFPILPLESYRATRNPVADVNLVVYEAKGFNVLQKLPLETGQVVRTYLFATSYAAWIALACWLFFEQVDQPDKQQMSPAMQWFYVGCLALALWLPFFGVSRWRRGAARAAK